MSISEQITAFIAMLAGLDTDTTESECADAARINELTALERAKSAICARQARVTDRFAASQRAKLIEAGSTSGDATRSVGSQVALARRDSPTRGNRHLGLAATLVHELPGVLRALERGDTSEWRVTLIARETAHLSREHRAQIDAAIADQLHGWGDARTEREARAWAQRLDPDGAADRARKTATDRRVSIRPAPECMAYLTAFLPMVEGITTYGVLHRAAMTANGTADDHRTKGQVMADTVLNGRPRKLGQPGFSGSPPRARASRNARRWKCIW